MSRAKGPHRSFFPFGNPFRNLSPKGSQLPSMLLVPLNKFEETLSERLHKLLPESKDDILSLEWLRLAVETLSQIHYDIKVFITDLELPVSDWEDEWIDVYLDISAKLLDICNAFSSELVQLSQGSLLLQCIVHKLEVKSAEKFMQSCSMVDRWRQLVGWKNPRIENSSAILNSLVESLHLPKVKNSSKGKVLMRAMYGVKVATVYICSILSAGFSGSASNLLHLNVSDSLPWAPAFSDLQATVNGEVRSIFSAEKFTALKELDAVDVSVKSLYPMIQGGPGSIQEQQLENSISDLARSQGKLSQGLDLLTKEVDGFFKMVLTGRDALLGNLRTGGIVPGTRTAEDQLAAQ